MNHSKLPYFFLALAALLAASAILLLIFRPGLKRDRPAESNAPQPPRSAPAQPGGTGIAPGAAFDPAKFFDNAGPGATAVDPAEIVGQVSRALEAGDLQKLAKLLGKDALDAETIARLRAIAASPPKIREGGIREIGEIELNKRTRWQIALDGREPGLDRVTLDLVKQDGGWKIEKLTLPPPPGSAIPRAAVVDSLGVSDAFLQAVLRQDFEFAKDFADPKTVSDAKIAGLCILFEEGGYKMRQEKPLRAMFQRDDTVGYLANLQSTDSANTAQFSLNLRKPADGAGNWQVSEINLDQLLADYARRVAGGDVYYSPLVKNPAGGDTLALYFEFDESGMNPRTRRQLEIVSLILKADAGKKITISGHTDALGSDSYNRELSEKRADAVRDFLTKAGVSDHQIVTLAKGASQPRRPNITESGADDPSGRRANRRTEIYLDF